MNPENLELFEMPVPKASEISEKRQYKNTKNRRTEIMMAVVSILSRPEQVRFTTKEISREVGISEAGIYRHFRDKSEIIMGVLDFCDHSIEEMCRKVDSIPKVSLMNRAVQKFHRLLAFGQLNPGIARILTGEALLYEAESVIYRKDQVLEKALMSITYTYRLAIINREIPNNFNYAARVELMGNILLGRLLRFSQSKFEIKPTNDLSHIDRLLMQV